MCTFFSKSNKLKEQEGIKTEWNGFSIFYDEKKNELEINFDIVGHRETLYFNNIFVQDFLNAISSKEGTKTIWDKIKEQSEIDKELIKEINNKGPLPLLKQYVGIYALKIDLGIGIKTKAMRDIYFAFLKRQDIPKQTTTTKQTISTTFIKKVTKPRPTNKYGDPLYIEPCKFFNKPKLTERYACSYLLSHVVIDNCLEAYHECIENVKKDNDGCSYLPNYLYYISIDKSKYNWECDKCLENKNNKCQQGHCECDRKVAQCWGIIPLKDDFDKEGNLKIQESEENSKEEVKQIKCPIKLIEEAKHFPNIPISAITKIRRNAFKNLKKLAKYKEKLLDPEVGPLLKELLVFVEQSRIELESLNHTMNTTFKEAIKNMKDLINTVKKTNDPNDEKAAEEYTYKYFKIKATAEMFGIEHSKAKKWLLGILTLGEKMTGKRVEML
ncbi:hypothetical protein Mgra_00010190, partial [Meloidogyne graminicola]